MRAPRLDHAGGALLVVASATVLAAPALTYAGPAMDEGLLLVYPELILRGAVPNRDFLAIYGPGDFWVLAAAYAAFGTSLGVERLVGLLYHLAIALAMFAHALRWGGAVALAAGVIVATLLVPLGLAAYAWLGALALALWSLVLVSGGGISASATRLASGGVLAGAAVLFRPDVGPAILLSALPLLHRLDWAERRAYLTGASLGLLGFAAHMVMAGPGAVIDNVFLGVFKWGAGRRLPLPPAGEPLLFALVVVAVAGLLLAALLPPRAGARIRDPALLAVALLSAGLLPQALQRADLFHLAAAGSVPVGLLPVTSTALLGRFGRAGGSRAREAAAAALAAVLLGAAAPRLVVRAALVEFPRGLGLQSQDGFALEHRGRIWYPLEIANDFTYTPVSSAESVRELGAVLSEVERLAPPGARLFVGPRDLRRTNVTDTVIYHLLPQLQPATYYLQMEPGSTNGPDSHLAADIGSADVLVLTSRYDGWTEPNASMLFGPDEPNRVVRDLFSLSSEQGTYSVYVRRGLSGSGAPVPERSGPTSAEWRAPSISVTESSSSTTDTSFGATAR